MVGNALANDQGGVRELVLEREATFASLRIVFLTLSGFWAARLQRSPLSRVDVVLWINQRVDMMVHACECMLQPGTVLTQPFFCRGI